MIRDRQIAIGAKSFRVRRLEPANPKTLLKETQIRIEEVGDGCFISIDLFPMKQMVWMLENPEFAGPFAQHASVRDLMKLVHALGGEALAYWLGRAGGKRGEAYHVGFAEVALGASRYELHTCLKQVMEILMGKKVVLVADGDSSSHEDLDYLGFCMVNGSEGLWIAGGKRVRFEMG